MQSCKIRAEWSFTLEGCEKTISLGCFLGKQISSPGLVALFGGLGSGKTTFIQALGKGLGVEGAITSPTYTIINSYPGGRLPLIHVDCYRLKEESELYELGLEELFPGDGVVCIEWSDRVLGLLPPARLEVHLGFEGRLRRGVLLRAVGDLWPEMDRAVERWIERNN